MATLRDRRRCRERLELLSGSQLDGDARRLEAIHELRRVIGFDRWCWPTADPAALVPLGGIAEHDYGPAVPRGLELEYSGSDFATMDGVARRDQPAGSLAADTSGDLARSPRWDEVLQPVGIGDEAVVACRDAFGTWGWIKAYRDRGERPFAEGDLELLADAAPFLGVLLRRRLGEMGVPSVDPPLPPGVILLDGTLRTVGTTGDAQTWIGRLPGAALFASWGILPPVVYPVAARARSGEPARLARAVDRTVDGRWVVIQASLLEADDAHVAVTLRGATPVETYDLFSRVYGLTRRERDVVAGLLAGFDTRALTQRLFISAHTVQDHLKSIFAKVGIHSRRELVARFNAADEGLWQRRPEPVASAPNA
jgi:DNA-binding CsgD family transcriptional regulator